MKIAIIPNYYKDEIVEASKHTARVLEKAGHKVYFHKDLQGKTHKCFGGHFDMEKECEVFIAIGGDGTIIHTAKHANGRPVIGINMGRIGYLAGLEFSEIDSICDMINGKCHYEERMLIDIKSSGRLIGTAVNEGVISGEFSKLLDFNVKINKEEFHFRADGIIVSTPTGSTAYSLSAGGPVVDPNTECMIFTPICPHTLFNRSLVFSDNTEVEINAHFKYDEKVILTIDGAKQYVMEKGEEVSFCKSAQKLRLMTKHKRNFFDVVNKKIMISEKR